MWQVSWGPVRGAQRRFALPHRPRTGPQLTCGRELKKAAFAAFFNSRIAQSGVIFYDQIDQALMIDSVRVQGQSCNVHLAHGQTNIHSARGKVGAEPGDLASEASYEPGQRPPCLRRYLRWRSPYADKALGERNTDQAAAAGSAIPPTTWLKPPST